ncbi:hypothetical protein NMY22_g3196 [Coprinellus aureogranulatus]|nr:hypothetical protein NMY22_g3196 [Coprinellus aureogranulatus]
MASRSLPYRCTLCNASFFVPILRDQHIEYHCEKRKSTPNLEHLVVGDIQRSVSVYRKRLRVSPSHYLPLHRMPDDEFLKRKRSITGSPVSVGMRTSVSPLTEGNQTKQRKGLDGLSRDNRALSSAPLTSQMNPSLICVADHLPEPLAPNLYGTQLESPNKVNPFFRRRKEHCTSALSPRVIDGPRNSFGLWRRYYCSSLPTHDPEEELELLDLYDSKYHRNTGPSSCLPSAPYGPFPNLASFELGEWYINSGTQFSIKNLEALVKIAQTPGFSEGVAQANWPKIFNILSDNRESLDRSVGTLGDWVDDDGWKQSPISFPIPIVGEVAKETMVGTLYHRSILSIVQQKLANSDVKSFHYEPFELMWQCDASGPSPIRVRSELYNSDAFIQAHRELQDSPPHPDCTRPRVVVGLMFWSDETVVTSFGADKIWPCYMLFANESKYNRGKLSADLCHHIAYFDSLSDSFKDFATNTRNGRLQPKFMAYCRCESINAQWEIMLDDELLEAMKAGIVVMCMDGIERRFYIRIFTYSADYPEKCLHATIRQRGDHPCPRCLIPTEKFDRLGTPEDALLREYLIRKDDEARKNLVKIARNKILVEKYAIAAAEVEALLKGMSLHPVMSAFSSRLSSVNLIKFDIFSSLTIDLMHEFELGVWKNLLIHLLRILNACGTSEVLLHELDKRYRQVPAFGRSIRRFTSNVSALQKKTARDYEDMLQCAIPVFEGLLHQSVYSQAVLNIILVCAEWHALAKLKMHTDATLALLENATKQLGDEFRSFVENVCAKIPTKALRSELEAQERHEQRRKEAAGRRRAQSPVGENPDTLESQSTGHAENAQVDSTAAINKQCAFRVIAPSIWRGDSLPPTPPNDEVQAELPPEEVSHVAPPKRKKTSKRSKDDVVQFNITTPKFHFLGDYVKSIRLFGTTDNYSTQLGELLHRFPKRWYKRTSKKNPRKDVMRYERRVARIRELRRGMKASRSTSEKAVEEQRIAAQVADTHHYIGSNRRNPIALSAFGQNIDPETLEHDPLWKSFLPSLQHHLLPRVIAYVRSKRLGMLTSDGKDESDVYADFSAFSPSLVAFQDHRIYSHPIMRIKYTTYDVRRQEDVVHVDSDVCNIMVLNPQYLVNRHASPYRYARVLGIFHAHVGYMGEVSPGGIRELTHTQLEFLWVRWYMPVDEVSPTGESLGATPPLEFIKFPDITSADSISFIDPNIVLRGAHIIPRFHTGKAYEDGQGLSEMGKDSSDWNGYWVNRFADRDMYMRYHIGMGVGHKGIWPASAFEAEVTSEVMASGSPTGAGSTILHAPASQHKETSNGMAEGEEEPVPKETKPASSGCYKSIESDWDSESDYYWSDDSRSDGGADDRDDPGPYAELAIETQMYGH